MQQALQEQKSRFERDFFLRLKSTSLKSAPAQLREATLYALSGSNKRIRPILTLESAAIAGLQENAALPMAAAFECLHSYSLVHDDLPAMDNDDMRRGQPSCHKKFGEATAILVGDLLQSLSFELLTHANLQPMAFRYFARAIGAQGMVSGQYLDMENHDTTLKRLHRLKTGRLIEAAINLPVLAATSNLSLPAIRWGRGLGLLFQMTDDVIDATSDSATLGKTAGKDAEQDKKTFIRELGLDQTRTLVQKLADKLSQDAKTLFAKSTVLQQLPSYLQTRRN